MHRSLSLATTSAVVVGTLLLPGLAAPARADLPVQLTAGTALPERTVAGTDGGLISAAPGYAIGAKGLVDANEPGVNNRALMRLSDGSDVRPIDADSFFTTARLSGDVLIRFSGQVVTAEEIETGVPRWTVTALVDDQVLSATAAGALVSRAGVLHLLRPGGGDAAATSALSNAANALVVADTRTAVFRGPSGLHTLDLVTGASATLTTSIGPYAPVVLAQSRVFWVEKDPFVDATEQVTWAGRDGSAGGTVAIAVDHTISNRYFRAVGDTLLRAAESSDVASQDVVASLAPVNLTTGQLGAVLATRVLSLLPEGDGRAVLHRLTANGSEVVEVSADLDARVVTALPPRTLRALRLRLDGARTVADFGAGPFDGGGGDTRVTATAGGGTWTSAGPGALLAASGGALVTRKDASTFRITSAAGSFFDLPSADVRLGRGGVLFTSRGEPGSQGGTAIKRVSDGVIVDQLLEVPPAYAIDGDRVWTGPYGDGSIQGRVAGGTALPTAQSGLTCTPYSASLTVAGRWAVAGCYASNALDSFHAVVVDLAGVRQPYALPTDEQVSLGNGYLVSQHPVDGNLQVARVLDLTTHEVRDYGPVHPEPYAPPVADGAEALRIAWLDGRSQVRTAGLDWVTPASDTVAPVLQSLVATAGPTTSTTIGATWSFADGPAPLVERASGVVSYDLRARSRSLPGGAFGAYGQLTTTATAFQVPVAAGSQTCWSVRATDAAGNTSAWSAERCTVVDGAAPRLTGYTAGPAVQTSVATTNVTFAYAGSDDVGVASYDVALKYAGPGQALSAFQFPATWQKRTARTVVKGVPAGGQACFVVRSRDVVGRVSAWSPLRCSAVPLDDRRLTSAGPVSRLASAAALGGTLTRLEAPGAQLAVAGQTGRRLALVALAGPGRGVADVFVGGRRVARLDLASGPARRQVFVVPGGAGTVVVRAVTRGVVVDALAVLRD